MFRHLSLAGLAVAACLPACALADSTGTYLTWQNKTAPVSGPQTDAQGEDTPEPMAYPAPASPYGQVGDPFRRNLNWPSKKTPQDLPKAQAASEGPKPYLPPQVAPARTVASRPETPKSITVQPLPAPKPAPQVTIVEPAPPPPPVLSVAKPLPVPQPHPAPAATASVSTPTPLPAPKPVVVPPQAVATAPAPKPAATPEKKPATQTATAPAPTPSQATADDGYQVPATSKYATQLKAARAAQARDIARQQAAEAQEGRATAPEPSEQLAVHETDHVFIPGETYKDEGDAPRLYSLHRMYGLQPDPITVSPEAGGTILDGADLHADEAPKKSSKDPVKESKAKPEGK